MGTTERKLIILNTITQQPLDKWVETEDHAGRRYYRQEINGVTFRFYPPNGPDAGPYLTVVRDENDLGEIQHTFFESDDPNGLMPKLWSDLLDYRIKSQHQRTERNIDIIYEQLVARL